MGIHLQNNIFTLTIYENVKSFVPQALGGLPPTHTSLVEELVMKNLILLQVLLECTQ